MEDQILPIVPTGKYAGKSVLDLMADEWYVNNVLQKDENKKWFNPTNKNWAPIYNIIVNQNISTNKDGKTPEHNKLQNLFLEPVNQEKLLSQLFKFNRDKLKTLFTDEDIIRCFGIKTIPKLIYNLNKTSVKFEERFNWDVVLYYTDKQSIRVESNLENELIDKAKYKEQYDITQKENHDNYLLLIDRLIESVIKLDNDKIHKYKEFMKDYQHKCEKYETDLKIYLQQKPQNDKDILNYEVKLNIYKKKLDEFIKSTTHNICIELGIIYTNFAYWNSHIDKDTTYTSKEKNHLKDIVNDKLTPFITKFKLENKEPSIVKRLNIPIKPIKPIPLEKTHYISCDSDTDELIKKCNKIKNILPNYLSVDSLYGYIQKYKNECIITNPEENFNSHYKEYRTQYYKDIIKKYECEYDFRYDFRVKNINNNQYEIIKPIDYYHEICCELKPLLSDDYPCVLRKLNAQIQLTNDYNTKIAKESGHTKRKTIFTLIVGKFTSINVSKEQLITIFKQSNIKVIFTDDLFDTTKYAIQYNIFENKLISENKTQSDNLLETQQKLLYTEEKNKQLEEKIKRLEEEIQSLKTQKQNKTIKNYFCKK